MYTATILATAVLAGQIATAFYIPSRQAVAEDADTTAHFSLDQAPTTTASVVSSYGPVHSSYAPTSSVQYSYEPSFIYSPANSADANLAEEKRDDGLNPINGLPVAPTTTADGTNPINGLPVASSVSTAYNTPESPNPTAIPSSFGFGPGITIMPLTQSPGITIVPLTQSVVSGHTSLVPITTASSHQRSETTLITKTRTLTSFDYISTHSPSTTSSPKKVTETVTVTISPPASTVTVTANATSSSSTVKLLTATGSPTSTAQEVTLQTTTGKGYEFPLPSNTETASATSKPKKDCIYPIPGADCP